ncbi:hypothetical protein AJ79_07961 [Helicocarpus griseus UAMH5409]|uniref:Uncharacterized protein n=1 Tax=Helicocarpus griseus UAMH5409 TaxID=1447875 RepID=A0A2B7WXB7_9EURO|nr:hypothetical protein AJ79_07961 [Helicocarpus griseus UAMH5409]
MDWDTYVFSAKYATSHKLDISSRRSFVGSFTCSTVSNRVMQACLRPGRAKFLGHRFRLFPSSIATPSWKHIGSRSQIVGPPPTVETVATLLVRSWNPGRQWHVPYEERKDSSRWISELEKYLPLELRENAKGFSHMEKESETEQCLVILDILNRARGPDSLGRDLLMHLGVELGRWSMVHAIVNKLLDHAEKRENSPAVLKKGSLPSNIDWASLGSFNTITGNECRNIQGPGVLRHEGEEKVSLDSIDLYSDGAPISGRMGEKSLTIGTMDELWPALGSIVLEAADLPPEESRTAMFYFYRIVARLHHIGFIPHGVYKYSTSQLPERLNCRTPAMHLLSSHIMNVLLDAVWIGDEIDSAATALAAGKEVSAALKYKIRVRPLGLEIWLEFILWCCVEGGYSIEGSWILKQLATKQRRWFVESFASHSVPLDAINLSKIDRYDTWASCAGGTKSADVNESRGPFVGLGERTISSEVVTSTMDGLNNITKIGVGHRGVHLTSVLNFMKILIRLLQENNIHLKPRDVHHLIIRMIEARGVIPDANTNSFEQLLEFASTVKKFPIEESSGNTGQAHLLDRAAVGSGLNHHLLDAYVRQGHIYKARRLFDRLELISSSEKKKSTRPMPTNIDETSAQLAENSTAEPLDENPVQTSSQKPSQAIYSNPGPNTASLTGFSSSSLSRLLNLSTLSGVYDPADLLLFGREENPVLSRDCYLDDTLAPAIIRFAAATENEKLLFTVAEDLPVPWPDPVIKAFFDYNVRHHEWDQVMDTLFHLKEADGGGWTPSEVASLAAEIIRLDERQETAPLTSAREILFNLLSGDFNPRPQYSEGQRRNFRDEMLLQFKRLFKSIPGTLSAVSRQVEYRGKATRLPPPLIPSLAFDHILSAVLETRGIAAGKSLCRMWCVDKRPPNTRQIGHVALRSQVRTPESLRGLGQPVLDFQVDPTMYTKLVKPSIQTVRIIVRAMVREFHDQVVSGDYDLDISPDKHKRKIYTWARDHFAPFRLERDGVLEELHNYWEEAVRERGAGKEKESIMPLWNNQDASSQSTTIDNGDDSRGSRGIINPWGVDKVGEFTPRRRWRRWRQMWW